MFPSQTTWAQTKEDADSDGDPARGRGDGEVIPIDKMTATEIIGSMYLHELIKASEIASYLLQPPACLKVRFK